MGVVMEKLIIAFLIIISSVHLLPAQTDFLISDLNIPSTFIQDEPVLYSSGKYGFTVIWKDYRDGEPAYYAQRFDATGNFIGSNLKSPSNLGGALAGDGSLFFLRHTIHSYYYPDWDYTDDLSIEGIIYSSHDQPSGWFGVGGGTFPWCGTGWWGYETELVAGANSFIAFTRFGSSGGLHKYDNKGNKLYSVSNDHPIIQRAVAGISGAFLPGGEYMTAWISAYGWEYSDGIYGSFFSDTDSLIADTLLLFPVHTGSSDYWYWDNMPQLKVAALDDSIYQIYFFDSDSNTLFFRQVSVNGTFVGNADSLVVHTDDFEIWGRSMKRLQAPAAENGTRVAIFISLHGYKGTESRDSQVKAIFDANGELVHYEVVHDTTASVFPSDGYYAGEDRFYQARTVNNDIYLFTVNGETVIDSILINDDASGGNQLLSNIKSKHDGSYFVTWKDEQKFSGRFVTGSGDPVGQPTILDGSECIFLGEETAVCAWIQRTGQLTVSGFTMYDETWSVTGRDTLGCDSGSPAVHISILRVPDNTFIIAYNAGNNIYLQRYNAAGERLKQVIVSAGSDPGSLRLFNGDGESFFMSRDGNRIQSFSYDLEFIDEGITLPYSFNTYLGEGCFVHLVQESNAAYYAKIFDIHGDVLKDSIYIAFKPEDITINNLAEGNFIVLYVSGRQIVGRTFSREGIAFADSFIVSQPINSFKKTPSAAVSGDNVLIAWAETRIPGRGYDIYGRIFSLHELTTGVEIIDRSVPQSFVLYQNYPNPFNPSTLIEYAVPHSGSIHLAVYDLLGREVAVLVNEYQQAGTYRVTFDADRFASGVYVYRLTAGDYADVKRMVLLR
jgi:hypothetical protein